MGLLGFPPATPLGATCPGGSRTPVPDGTQAGLTSVFGMGTGVTPPLWSPKAGPRESNPRVSKTGASNASVTQLVPGSTGT